ncbi:sulfotransferase family protein [Ectothiorhodospira lacustris]|uniref:sulfotransferase family protein n=1 Tax=Ectothiorhodospira lacustris TaxID=2899127 RepID=UPI001EE7FDDF|nr:sulfotransferase [Ectothiorhodospira lacustris]MCG5502255.1 sulfotransferase [Ectothiorhodospira lacustris]
MNLALIKNQGTQMNAYDHVRSNNQRVIVKLWNLFAPYLGRNAGCDSEVSVEKILGKLSSKVDFSAPHVEGLSCLVSSINKTGNLHAFGRFYVNSMLSELLLNRERLNRFWQAHPEVLSEQKIVRPVIILGLPRSGTSYLFNLMSQDSEHRFLRNWETTVSQVPVDMGCDFRKDPRRRKGMYLMWLQNYLAPQLKEIHEFHLDGPEECTPLLMQSFATQALAGVFNVPEYSSWLSQVSHDEAYSHHKRILQTLQWRYPGRRWLLKSPDHLAAINSILKVYPDACLVHLHRDPLQSVASWASLNSAFRGICSQSIDLTQLGRQVLDRLATDMDRYMDERQAWPKSHFYDVHYDDFIKDPKSIVESIYEYFDLDLKPDSLRRMSDFLLIDTKKVRGHRYRPEDFNLSSDQVDQRFARYVSRFKVPVIR